MAWDCELPLKIKERVQEILLKVPNREIFDVFDFNDFYVMKCLFILASVCAVTELSHKKVVSDSFEIHLNVSK